MSPFDLCLAWDPNYEKSHSQVGALENAVSMPGCPRELAKAQRVTDRHARRIWADSKADSDQLIFSAG